MDKVIVVVAEFQGVLQKVIVCKDKETANNFALDLINEGSEVATYDCKVWDMEKYNNDKRKVQNHSS